MKKTQKPGDMINAYKKKMMKKTAKKSVTKTVVKTAIKGMM